MLSSNPDKVEALTALGIQVVARHGLAVPDRPENTFYLTTKRLRMGHDSAPPWDDVWHELARGRVPQNVVAVAERDLVERYGPLVEAGPELVIAQLAQSADGFIATKTGDADYVSGPADREHLHRLRALVDAVVGRSQHRDRRRSTTDRAGRRGYVPGPSGARPARSGPVGLAAAH